MNCPWYANRYIELFCQKLQLAKLIDLLLDLLLDPLVDL